MNRNDAKRLQTYFEDPPVTDYLTGSTKLDPVLACPIERSPAWPAMQAIGMLKAEQTAADRLRRHIVRLGNEAFDADHQERAIEPTVNRVLIATQLAKEPPQRRNAKVVRFTPHQFRRRIDPLKLALTSEQLNDKVALYQNAARMMWNGADWDPSLEIAAPKIAEQLLYMCERLLFNIEKALRDCAQQLNALSRQTMNDEIPRQQIERLEWKQAGLRVQERHYQLMTYAFKAEAEAAKRYYEAGTGRSWGAYEGIKARAERSAREWRSKMRRRSSLSMVIENMTTEEFNRWAENTKRYEPKVNGVDLSDDEAGAADDMHGILTELTPEGMEWSGDDEWTSDGVHRQGHDGGFLDSE
jgi:hypothetical protein